MSSSHKLQLNQRILHSLLNLKQRVEMRLMFEVGKGVVAKLKLGKFSTPNSDFLLKMNNKAPCGMDEEKPFSAVSTVDSENWECLSDGKGESPSTHIFEHNENFTYKKSPNKEIQFNVKLTKDQLIPVELEKVTKSIKKGRKVRRLKKSKSELSIKKSNKRMITRGRRSKCSPILSLENGNMISLHEMI